MSVLTISAPWLGSTHFEFEVSTTSLICVVATYQGVSPQFIVQPVDQVVVEGATVVLFCAANGRDHSGGRPNVVWLKDGAALELEYVIILITVLLYVYCIGLYRIGG